MIRDVGEAVTKLVMRTWKAEATTQRKNLESNRDVTLLTRVLPLLKSVDSIIFAGSFFYGDGKSPAFGAYSKFVPRETDLPIATYWRKLGETYLPDPEVDLYYKLSTQDFESGFWKTLCVRGLTILHDILSHRESEGVSTHRTCLQHLFPRLRRIDLDGIPADFIFPSSGGPAFGVLQESTSGIQELSIAVPGPDSLDTPVQFSKEIMSIAQMYSKSLQCLMVEVDISNRDDLYRIPLIPAMTQLLPQLALVSSITIWMGALYTTHAELLAFGKVVKACRSLRSLVLGELCFEVETWWGILNK